MTQQVLGRKFSLIVKEDADGCPDDSDDALQELVGLDCAFDWSEANSMEESLVNPGQIVPHLFKRLDACLKRLMGPDSEKGLVYDLHIQTVLEIEEVF